MTEPQKSDDEKQRDEILRRMLKTPPNPHGESKNKKDIAPSRTGEKSDSE
jgi:hypothetical protein|tara:strand:- start:369 stop:518 length:150 start_codon:yes stop_codon:yes gene_type:complete